MVAERLESTHWVKVDEAIEEDRAVFLKFEFKFKFKFKFEFRAVRRPRLSSLNSLLSSVNTHEFYWRRWSWLCWFAFG